LIYGEMDEGVSFRGEIQPLQKVISYQE